MGAATIAEEFRSLSRQPPTDPDIQATLSDYLTYTEHFPSQVTRALTLIGEQTRKSERQIASIHRDTTSYALLPTLPKDSRPNAVDLRKNISYALEEAERACRMRVEEAIRLEDTALREAKRLDIVVEKLKAQPMPPSRDPTPAADEQRALTSPNLKRESRIGTRSDEIKVAEKTNKRALDKAASKLRGRKVMVPGEVLPPPDPNALQESVSDWTSPRVSPPVEEPPIQIHRPLAPRHRSRTPKLPKQDKEKMEDNLQRTPKQRGPRQPGQPGTNAHSSVAGISTSNALLALKAPPEDAPQGSAWLPWTRLTEWEMAKLRKRMKKNAIWVPSQTMVRRELKVLGRGLGGRDAAKQAAEDGGPPFVDESNESDPTKVEVSGEDQATMNAMLGPAVYTDGNYDADAELINRGMRLNEAKKIKRAKMLEEQQEAAAQIAREQGLDSALPITSAAPEPKKRKREATPTAAATTHPIADTPDPISKPGPPLKKLKLAPPALQPSAPAKVPLAPAGPSSSPKPTTRNNRRAATPPISKRPSLILKASKAVSEEPPNRRASLRRGSNSSLPGHGPPATLASPTKPPPTTKTSARRSKRPAPGVITNGDHESAKVGISNRKSAPKKKAATTKSSTATTAAAPPEPVVEDELVDPDEPRYCVCGDVSWGNMIACDNEENCEKEWFHLSCVGLEDLPPRRTKWYCPDCRKKLKLGVATNGLVGRMGTAAGAGSGR